MNAEQTNTIQQEAIPTTEELSPTETQAPAQEETAIEAATANPEEDATPEPDEQPIDPALIEEIRRMVEAALNSRFYMGNPNRIKALKDSLNIPISDDKSFQLFFHHAENDLEMAANKIARKNRTVPPEVTTADIVAEAQKRYRVKHKKDAIINEEYVA